MGSLNTSMHELRQAFAKIYPPSVPGFHYHFSTLARTAITEDARRQRFAYPVGGTMGEDYDPMVGDPIILPGKSVFHDSKDSFRRALGDDWNQNRNDTRSQSRAENISTQHTLQSENSSRINPSDLSNKKSNIGEEGVSKSGKAEEGSQERESLLDRMEPSFQGQSFLSSHIPARGSPNLRPHPRFSPPHNAYTRHVEFVKPASRRGKSNTPSGTPPSSPVLPQKKSRQNSPLRSRIDSQLLDSQPRRKSNFSPTDSSRKRKQDTSSGPSSSRHTEVNTQGVSTQISQSEDDDDSSIFNDNHGKKSKTIEVSSSEDSSGNLSSDSEVDNKKKRPLVKPQINFVAKVKQSYPFEKAARSKSLESYSKDARKVQKCVVKYLSDIKQAVNAFNSCGAKPTNFPTELTRDLLEYNFIDTEIIYAHNIEKKSKSKSYDSDDKNTGSRKIKPRPIEHFGHWQKIMDTLREAYISAFPYVKDHFNAYFDDLVSLTRGFLETAEWDKIRDYDVEMRLEFAARPWLTFQDFDHQEVNSIKNRVLYMSNNTKASSSKRASSSRTTKSARTSESASSKAKGRKNRSKRMVFPYELKDSSGWEMADKPCDLWNANICPRTDEECHRAHQTCNKLGCDKNHRGGFTHRRA